MQLIQSKHTFKASTLCTALLTTLALSGCGGGSGGSTPGQITNSSPTVSGDNSVVVAENQVEVASYSATDPDGDSFTFSISGADASLFNIDANGNLSFVEAPDYDAGETGPFAVNVLATDTGGLTGSLVVSVTVSDEVDPATHAVVQTIAADFVSGSEVMFIDGQSMQVTGPYYVKTQTDYSIDTYGNSIYHIGSFFIDTIEKYSADSPDTQVWSYSTQDSGDSTSRNPYTIVSLSDEKAYLIRYGSDKVWIVNPSVAADDIENFKIGELDLSGYNLPGTVGGTPNPAAGIIVDGKLYISMQRFSDNFSEIGTGYVAVFDTETDTEIETNASDADTVMGIPLQGTNAARNGLVYNSGKVYVTTTKQFGSTDLTLSRIETIRTEDYAHNSILDATSIEGNTGSSIKGTLVVSDEQGYFYTSEYDANFNELSTLYQFNPSTGEITGSDIGGNGTETISYATLDSANIIWMSIANPANPGIDLIDTATNSKIGNRLATEFNPSTIRFIGQ